MKAVKFEPLGVAFFECGLVEAGEFVLRLVGEGKCRWRLWRDDFVFWAWAVAHNPVEECEPDVA